MNKNKYSYWILKILKYNFSILLFFHIKSKYYGTHMANFVVRLTKKKIQKQNIKILSKKYLTYEKTLTLQKL